MHVIDHQYSLPIESWPVNNSDQYQVACGRQFDKELSNLNVYWSYGESKRLELKRDKDLIVDTDRLCVIFNSLLTFFPWYFDVWL